MCSRSFRRESDRKRHECVDERIKFGLGAKGCCSMPAVSKVV